MAKKINVFLLITRQVNLGATTNYIQCLLMVVKIHFHWMNMAIVIVRGHMYFKIYFIMVLFSIRPALLETSMYIKSLHSRQCMGRRMVMALAGNWTASNSKTKITSALQISGVPSAHLVTYIVFVQPWMQGYICH